MPKAIVTGVSGQDGWYMAEYLRGLGYEVVSVVRTSRYSLSGSEVPLGTRPGYGDITDPVFVMDIVKTEQPQELIKSSVIRGVNLAAQDLDAKVRNDVVRIAIDAVHKALTAKQPRY